MATIDKCSNMAQWKQSLEYIIWYYLISNPKQYHKDGNEVQITMHTHLNSNDIEKFGKELTEFFAKQYDKHTYVNFRTNYHISNDKNGGLPNEYDSISNVNLGECEGPCYDTSDGIQEIIKKYQQYPLSTGIRIELQSHLCIIYFGYIRSYEYNKYKVFNLNLMPTISRRTDNNNNL